MDDSHTTTTTTTSVPKPNEVIRPEWVSVSGATKASSLKRSKLYEAIKLGKIKSVSIRERGAIHGRRLINYDSLMRYIESFIVEENAPSVS